MHIQMKRFSFILAAGVAAAIAVASVQGVSIAWKPKAGDTTKYKLTTKANIQGQEMFFSAVLTSKVLEVTSDKIVVEEKQSELNVKFGDQDFSSMMPASITSTTTLKPNGEVIERKSEMEDGGSERMEAALAHQYPEKAVEKGGSWTIKRAANADKKLPASEATYTYVEDEKVGAFDTWKITYVFKETEGSSPMTVNGTLWLNRANGEPVKAVYQMQNVEFQEGMGTSDAQAEITRID